MDGLGVPAEGVIVIDLIPRLHYRRAKWKGCHRLGVRVVLFFVRDA